MTPNKHVVDLCVDEVEMADFERTISLLESIYVNAVHDEVNHLCAKNCVGCLVELSNRQDHECLMMPEETKWEIYGESAMDIVNLEHSILAQFIEALRVLRLPFHKDNIERLKHLETTPIPVLYTSWLMYCNKNDHELNCILTYLHYWRNK